MADEKIEDIKEMEDFLEKDLKKDINQTDKISNSVDQHLGEMGFLWDTVQKKFQEDKICFACKKEFDLSQDKDKNKMTILIANAQEKGVCAFVSICEDCFIKEQKKREVKNKNE